MSAMPNDPFFIIWFFVLPILAICFLIFAPIFYFVIMPKLARKFIWGRFRNTTVVPVAHAEGYLEFEFSKKSMHEGVLEVGKRTYRFLPRPLRKDNKSEDTSQVEEVALKKYIIKDYGKPIIFGYAGKTPTANAEVLANFSGVKKTKNNPEEFFTPIQEYIENELPKKHHSALFKLLESAHQKISVAVRTIPLINLDLEVLKEHIPQMYTPSQVKAIAEEEFLLGQDSKDRDIVKLGFLALAIIALLILGLVAMTQL